MSLSAPKGSCWTVYGITPGPRWNTTTTTTMEHLIRREVFLEAKKYGEQFCHPLDKPRRLYVILNPQAGNSKSKKLFMKNADPIFHLAGIDVTYIQTSYEGHSKTLVNYFDPNIDGVVVAGGDGTLQEVVTGLLRQNNSVKNVPIGFIPLGSRSNIIYRKLFGDNVVNVRSICKSAMAIVKANTKLVDVLEVNTGEKSIYALSSIHIGLQQHAKERIDSGRFWLLGPLKQYFAFIWSSIKDWPFLLPLDIITSSYNGMKLQNVLIDELHSKDSDISGINISLVDQTKKKHLILEKISANISRLQYIYYGWNWIRSNFSQTEKSEVINHVECEVVDLQPPDDATGIWYDIDGELFEARKVKISVCPTQIKMFCNDET